MSRPPATSAPPQQYASYNQPQLSQSTYSLYPQAAQYAPPPQYATLAAPPTPMTPVYAQAAVQHGTPSLATPFSSFASAPAPAPAMPTAQNDLLTFLSSILPANVAREPTKLAQALQLFQELTQRGIPQDQWAPVLAALDSSLQSAPPQQTWVPPVQSSLQSHEPLPAPNYVSYDGLARYRQRSRSPEPRGERNGNTNRRPSPVYGTYDAAAAQAQAQHRQEEADRRNKSRMGGRQYRQRSPVGAKNGRGDSPIVAQIRPKWTDVDTNVPNGHIKVLSRTLFVGGANGTESELRSIFSRFGEVQTCIVNRDKRHAFVKMATRADALAAKQGMEDLRDPESLSKARQTKWGVGFGPRDCSDYTTGISIIPIDALTQADLKWMLTAEHGGTGGLPIESGLVVEEPDIEIGAGVSSKAISRRVAPDPHLQRLNARPSGRSDGASRFRQSEPQYESPRPDPGSVPQPNPLSSFGFNFAMPGGQMPRYG
ncbi:hypothetical protein LTR50_004372 [Elasticomyces elasticus]|nr:hypothetical protein LTR50_004372 [Elasticomyces elasticus]